MKKISVVSTLFTVLLLSACSKGPSEGESKAMIQGFIANCPFLSVEKFSKVNAAAVGNGENFYDVAVAYTIKIKPDPEQVKLLAAAEKEQNEDTKRSMMLEIYGIANQKCPGLVDILGVGLMGNGAGFSKENTSELSETYRMVKTDKGWIAKQ